jgi:glucose/arabinose dehydrogenase
VFARIEGERRTAVGPGLSLARLESPEMAAATDGAVGGTVRDRFVSPDTDGALLVGDDLNGVVYRVAYSAPS